MVYDFNITKLKDTRRKFASRRKTHNWNGSSEKVNPGPLENAELYQDSLYDFKTHF